MHILVTDGTKSVRCVEIMMRNLLYYIVEKIREHFSVFAGVLVILAFSIFSMAVWPRLSGIPSLALKGDGTVVVAMGAKYKDEGAVATLKRKDLSDLLYTETDLDTSVPGEYDYVYKVDGRWKTASIVRKIIVEDQTAPVITLKGKEKNYVEKIEDYKDKGAKAKDNLDGDVTAQMTSEMKQVNDYTYEVTYRVKDQAGNEAVKVRKVMIQDEVAPQIFLVGSSSITIQEREKFEDPGVFASDDRDGDISKTVQKSGFVDIYRPGTYTVTYTAQDECGNQASVRREVVVERVNHNPDKAVYLTFDDGPSKDVTPQILDILAANHIKATFFIVNYDEESLPIIQRMIDEGHTVGLHSYSHVYSQIYASADAFMENLYKLRDKLKADTGYEAFVMRFPGGSNNTVVENSSEIMPELVQRVTDEGMMYLDWNVSNEDATGNNISASELVQHVKDYLRPEGTNVILMHDTSAKQSTADALQGIIDYCTAQGHRFYPVEENTVPIHMNMNYN